MAIYENTIKRGLEEYLHSLSTEEKSRFLLENSTVLAIIHGSENDEAILSRAHRHDEKNGTSLFKAVKQFRLFCDNCHKLQCDCSH